jgi:thiamine-monophosphate kinase
LFELARQSGVNFLIDTIPSAKGITQFALDNDLAVTDLVFYGGEEYEIIATIPKSSFEVARALTRKLKLKLYVIGKVETGNGKVITLDERRSHIALTDRGYMPTFGP